MGPTPTTAQNLRQGPPEQAPGAPQALVSSKTRGVMLTVLGVTLALGLSYWVGYVEGSAKTEAVQQKAEDLRAGHEKASTELHEQLDARTREVATLQARRRLHQSELALAVDNFGTAREHLAAAHQLLMSLEPIPGSALSDLAEALAGVDLAVAKDSLPQRQQLRDLAQRFDAILDA